jgi:hypothetical protein
MIKLMLHVFQTDIWTIGVIAETKPTQWTY